MQRASICQIFFLRLTLCRWHPFEEGKNIPHLRFTAADQLIGAEARARAQITDKAKSNGELKRSERNMAENEKR